MMKYDRKYISDEAVEKYDDARFALLVEGYSARLGEKYVEENRQLKEDDSFEFPSELDEKCLKAIDSAIAHKRRHENMEKAKKVAKRLTVVAASFLLVIVLSSVVLYNTVEAFRLSVVDYVISLFDIGEGSIVSVEANEADKSNTEVVPKWLPEGYELERDKSGVGVRMMQFTNGYNRITFTVHSDVSMGSFTVDTENAVETFDIKILNFNGIAVKKDHETFLYWFDADTAYHLWIDLVDLETIVRIAESCYK